MAQEDKLFIDKLEGVKNWQVWKYQMQVILEARELWGHVDGMATKPGFIRKQFIKFISSNSFRKGSEEDQSSTCYEYKFGSCTSQIWDKLKEPIKAPIPEDEHIVAMLLSLPRSYNTLTTALTAKGDELSLTQVHQALTSEEEKRGLHKGKDGGGRVDKGETALRHEKTS
ncbi:Hypothetical predicted protein [Paramuricea clavata]|uniref:Uncharacterized protein n=1 Tax=Paramuricea clavata TaxID=317549 RepID=A0A7D9EQD3_PARCT|nr:Hypothetical predicted protein [Paramuricea clavata]